MALAPPHDELLVVVLLPGGDLLAPAFGLQPLLLQFLLQRLPLLHLPRVGLVELHEAQQADDAHGAQRLRGSLARAARAGGAEGRLAHPREVQQERDGGAQVEVEEEAPEVLLLSDGGYDDLKAKDRNGHDGDEVERHIRALAEGGEAEVVSEEGVQGQPGSEDLEPPVVTDLLAQRDDQVAPLALRTEQVGGLLRLPPQD
mmetsp:Transcript_29296/g.86980  ORF Transcript_29296/g.86980 Transcript_29296/m.86980 type:complete len:201 (+) Transcript_29296:1174-1776(+)